MQRRWWWIVLVALVGVSLAIVLLPRPDTGDDIAPPPAPRAAQASERPAATPPRGVTRPGEEPVDAVGVQAVRPELAAIREARNKPEVVYAGKVMGPWSAMRYVLLKDGSPEAKALGDEINTEVMAELRKIRTADDPLTIWPVLEPKMDALAATIAESRWGSDESVVKSIERYRTTMQDFHDAQAGKGPAEPGITPEPSPEPEPEPSEE